MSVQNYRIDNKVGWFFFIAIVIAAVAFGYRMMSVDTCPQVRLVMSDEVVRAGELVTYELRGEGIQSVEWDFGDNTAKVAGNSQVHLYQLAGEYMIRLKINGVCSEVKSVVVDQPRPVVNKDLMPSISCPKEAEIGEPVRFHCLTRHVKSFEWRFGETGKVDSKLPNPIYKFLTPGVKTVSLVINGNYKYIAKVDVYVTEPEKPVAVDKPAAPRAEVKVEEKLPEKVEEYDTFEEMKVVNKQPEKVIFNDAELKAAILSYIETKPTANHFGDTFCSDIREIGIVDNGKTINLSSFLSQMKGQRIDVRKFSTRRQGGSSKGCVEQVIIEYKKR